MWGVVGKKAGGLADARHIQQIKERTDEICIIIRKLPYKEFAIFNFI